MTVFHAALALGAGLIIFLAIRAIRETLMLRGMQYTSVREHDMPRIASYCALNRDSVGLPSRAWADLDMDELFRHIDRTTCWPGLHLLYARLHREDYPLDTQRDFEAGVTYLTEHTDVRARIRAALTPLNGPRASVLPSLFQRPLPDIPAVARVFPLLSMLGLGCLVTAFWWPPAFLAVATLALTNAFIRVAMRERVLHLLPAMRTFPALVRASVTLADVDAPALAEWSATLTAAIPKLRRIGHAARWLAFEPTGGNELAGYVYEYINLLFLFDISAFAWSVEAIRTEQDTIRRTYESLGELDVRQAVASLRLDYPVWTRPLFIESTDRSLQFTSLTHPLLSHAVANSLDLASACVLLTGSNMSGKSTFVRTIGVNALLARTINTVFAERWCAPRYIVRTSIGRADSLLEGKSYYRAEVDAVGSLLQSDTAEPRLILIDELFRGTNSIERIAAAKAVLAHLDGGRDLVIVATHDVELLELLPAYAPFHFREDVRDGELTFDYQLHTGPCSTRNALAILALAGYPATLLTDARATAEEIEQRVVRKRAP